MRATPKTPATDTRAARPEKRPAKPPTTAKAVGKKKARGHRAKAPPGYMSIPAFGKKKWGLGRTASYAAVRRGEIPVVTLGQDWVPPNWEELLQQRALAKMDERQRQHAAKLASPDENPTDAAAIDGPEPQEGEEPPAPEPRRRRRRVTLVEDRPGAVQ